MSNRLEQSRFYVRKCDMLGYQTLLLCLFYRNKILRIDYNETFLLESLKELAADGVLVRAYFVSSVCEC